MAGSPTADARFSTFLSLSGEGIARFEMAPPLPVAAPEDAQVGHLLAHSRVAQCNELFAGFYARAAAEMAGLALGDFVPAGQPARLHGIRRFIRSGYRMVDVEEEHELAPGTSRWLSSSAIGSARDGHLHEFWLCLRDVTDRRRAEVDLERRGRILEAVAFSAVSLLQAGSWRRQADDVVARLGHAAQAARAWLGEVVEERAGGARLVYRSAWGAPGWEVRVDDPHVRDGVWLREEGLSRLEDEMRAGRPMATLVRGLEPSERSHPERMGSQSFAAVPIFIEGRWWGLLGFGETRYEREWSPSEIEALKAAAAVLGAAIERERADAALRESEERLERLGAATFEGIALTEDGVLLDANDQLAAMLGTSVQALVGQPVEGFVDPEDAALVKEHRAAGTATYEHRARRRDGTLFPVEVRAGLMPYRGRTVRVTAVRDVSARVEAELRQRKLEGDLWLAAEQWRQTFDALDLGIVLADEEGRIVRLNRSAVDEGAGPGFAQVVGRRLADLPDAEPWRGVRDLHRAVGAQRISVAAEARDAASGRSFQFLGSPWFRQEGAEPWRVVTFRDVTHYASMEEQLRRARVMEAMGSLVAGVAHEVRNPLFSISATVDALEAEIGRQTEFADYAALLRSQVGRLSQLMRDLLEYGKPSVLRRSPTLLSEVVRRATRACAALARDRRVTVVEQLSGEVPPLEIDSARAEQAFENLLANAIQHGPPGSTVRFVAEVDRLGPEPMVRCTVEDEGPGLEPASLAHIFEPFFSRRKGGTGLGLCIVRRVVESHGGTVSAGNREAGGACFTVLLPAGAAGRGETRG